MNAARWWISAIPYGPSTAPIFFGFVSRCATVLLWKLRKPERLQLEIERADGSRDLQSFVVEPNVLSEVWFYPWNQADLANYFAGAEDRWRTGPRPSVTHLRVLVTPLDWVSQQPDAIVIESADAVRMSMGR